MKRLACLLVAVSMVAGCVITAVSTVGAVGSTKTAGVRTFTTAPTALDTLSPTGAADGVLMRFKTTVNVAGMPHPGSYMYVFSSSGPASASDINLYVFTDPDYRMGAPGFVGGRVLTTNINPDANGLVTISPSNMVDLPEVPVGTTYYFELRGSRIGFIAGIYDYDDTLG